jgi:hypothetical protein
MVPKSIQEYIEVISLLDDQQFLVLLVFSDTPLRNDAYIKIDILKDCLDLGTEQIRLNLFEWEHYTKPDGTESNRFIQSKQKRMSINDLILHDTAMREYCKIFYPDRVL